MFQFVEDILSTRRTKRNAFFYPQIEDWMTVPRCAQERRALRSPSPGAGSPAACVEVADRRAQSPVSSRPLTMRAGRSQTSPHTPPARVCPARALKFDGRGKHGRRPRSNNESNVPRAGIGSRCWSKVPRICESRPSVQPATPLATFTLGDAVDMLKIRSEPDIANSELWNCPSLLSFKCPQRWDATNRPPSYGIALGPRVGGVVNAVSRVRSFFRSRAVARFVASASAKVNCSRSLQCCWNSRHPWPHIRQAFPAGNVAGATAPLFNCLM